MTFRVSTASSGHQNFDDTASYTFNEAGLLVIHLGVNAGRLTYSPQAWMVVEEPDKQGKYPGE
jgi:hypothetical protein